ncbi:MAG: FAD:protein FMN transferase [Flavobacteriaceae bacterium]
MNSLRFSALIFAFLLFCSCEKKETIKLKGSVFGTTYSIIYFGSDNYQEEINNLFKDVNKSLSTYIPTSDISKINNGEKGVEVDALFKEVFKKSERIYKETDGYFDPTVGDLVNAWGFGPKKGLNDLDSTTVATLMQFVGFNKVKIEENKVIKEFSETYFDFNSIAKGYGIDVIGRFLETNEVQNYLIEIGGEIRTRGIKANGKLWTVQLENPETDGSRSAYTYLKLQDKSMASSGNYRKFRIATDGQKYVHTINPKTGYATESNLLAATVIANIDCADVDAYATAFMAMGLERTKTFLALKPSLEVILIYADENGELKEYSNMD